MIRFNTGISAQAHSERGRCRHSSIPSSESRQVPLTAAQKALSEIAAEAAGCERCPLFRNAIQTVFGQGPAPAPVMLIGEQPGDSEDKAGLPFVGPAGTVLDSALQQAGINRSAVYVTNAVKHFKNQPRGKRRIHRRPNRYEVERCRWWLDKELALVRPRVTVALGATAASALAGRTVRIGKSRGRIIEFTPTIRGFVTVHPSYILRLRDEDRDAELHRLVLDLRRVGEAVPEAMLHGEPRRRRMPG
jgi:DNA polymerase